MPFRFEIEVSGEKLISRDLLRLSERVTDFAPAFEQITDDIRSSEQALFDTEGASSGNPWPALKETTLRRKLAQGLDPRILHARGPLEDSFTEGHGGTPAPNQIVVITPSALTFGSAVPYADAHQRGAGHLPKRRPMDFNETTKQQIVNRLQRWALTGEIRPGAEIR